jgi:hypothetical protein
VAKRRKKDSVSGELGAAEKRAEATSEALWDVCSAMSFRKGLWAGSIAKLFFSSLLGFSECHF